jgi:hypothetical protein
VFKSIGLFLLSLLLPAALFAQNPKSALYGDSSLWAGADFATYNPDFDCRSDQPWNCFAAQVRGPGAFVDFNVRSRWGAEGEARWLDWNGHGDQKISNYLLGGRYRMLRYHRLDIWAKMLFGGGWITTPHYPEAGSLKGSYFAYVPGAEVEYSLTRRLRLHGGYEYELWPSFDGPPTYSKTGAVTYHDNGLTPNGFSLGFTYRFLGQ